MSQGRKKRASGLGPRASARAGAKKPAAKRKSAAKPRAVPLTPATPGHWNLDPEAAQRSVARLVLTLVELLRQLMERQAIRRMEAGTLRPDETEAVGLALMRLEETVRELAARFGLTPEELNLDLGPLGKLI
jgi:hypothetical protein